MFYAWETPYSVMQSDGSSLEIDTFREAITSELILSHNFFLLFSRLSNSGDKQLVILI